jgi:hypothetical protein
MSVKNQPTILGIIDWLFPLFSGVFMVILEDEKFIDKNQQIVKKTANQGQQYDQIQGTTSDRS